MHSRSASLLLAAVTVAAVAGFLSAGPLNPPSGPVSAGGKTTQEIYDAVTNISGSIGSVGGRGPAVPGSSYTAGTVAFATTPPVSSPMIGLRHSLSRPAAFSGGGPLVGVTSLGSFTIVRELGTGSATLYKAQFGNGISTITATVPSAGGTTTYTLTNAYISAMRQYEIQRSDGTSAAIEEIDIFPVQVRVTEPNGTTWNWNYQTNVGGT